MDPRNPSATRQNDAPEPKLRAELPLELESIPDEPFVPLDIDSLDARLDDE